MADFARPYCTINVGKCLFWAFMQARQLSLVEKPSATAAVHTLLLLHILCCIFTLDATLVRTAQGA
jgi:hypothetical protein